jgi:small nuclear ribonucleoprotein (snRNP)-like protein
MGILSEELQAYMGKRIAVVLVDGARLRGKVVNYDERTIILTDVTELLDHKWVRPLISRSLGTELNQPHTGGPAGTPDIKNKDQGVLVKVIIRIRHVVRVWPWELKALPPKEPIESMDDV